MTYILACNELFNMRIRRINALLHQAQQYWNADYFLFHSEHAGIVTRKNILSELMVLGREVREFGSFLAVENGGKKVDVACAQFVEQLIERMGLNLKLKTSSFGNHIQIIVGDT